jgi:hypothetical protein
MEMAYVAEFVRIPVNRTPRQKSHDFCYQFRDTH